METSTSADFASALNEARSYALAQTGKNIEGVMTASGKRLKEHILGAGLAVAIMAGGAGVNPAHADGISFGQVVGAVLGATVGSQFGGGAGQVVSGIAGAAAGAWVGDKITEPKPSPGQAKLNEMSSVVRSGGSALPTTGEVLPPEKHEALSRLQQHAMEARDAFARSLYVVQQAEDERALNPRSQVATNSLSSARAAASGAREEFRSRSYEFNEAARLLGSRGYSMKDFAASHKLMQREVTAGDLPPLDMADIRPQSSSSSPTRYF